MNRICFRRLSRFTGVHQRWPGFVFLLIFTLAISAQPQAPPVFLNKLEFTFDQKINFPEKQLRKQYLNRIYTPELLREIKQAALENLKNAGYFFANVDSSDVKINTEARSAEVFLHIRSGDLLRLSEIHITNRDSLSASLEAEIDERIENYIGKYYTEPLVKSLFRDVLEVLENSGYPLARLRTGEFQFRESEKNEWLLQLSLAISPGDSVQIAYLKFPKQKSNLATYLQRLLRFKPGQRYEETRVSKYQQILRRQEFIREVKDPALALDKDGKHFLNIEFEETPSTALDGIIGYIPPPVNDPDAKGYFTGLINITVRNLFGGGRKMQIYWQKQDQFSDEFRLGYREPFIFGLPFHTQVGLYRLVRDTTFIEFQYNLNFEFPLSSVLSLYAEVASRSVSPDSLASRQLRLPITESLVTETGLRWDQRDDRLNPRKGLFLDILFGINRQDNKGPDYLLAEDSLPESETLQRMKADFAFFIPTLKRQVFANNFHFEFRENRGGELRVSDQLWFGGATTVRGFRESQFSARRVFWANTEYRFILNPQSRFFIFSDNAFYTRESPEKTEQWLTSYGLGLRVTGPLGIMQVDFGLEKGTPFREGKLHFRVINEF
jgi:outer membrane protein insertion porin family